MRIIYATASVHYITLHAYFSTFVIHIQAHAHTQTLLYICCLAFCCIKLHGIAEAMTAGRVRRTMKVCCWFVYLPAAAVRWLDNNAIHNPRQLYMCWPETLYVMPLPSTGISKILTHVCIAFWAHVHIHWKSNVLCSGQNACRAHCVLLLQMCGLVPLPCMKKCS